MLYGADVVQPLMRATGQNPLLSSSYILKQVPISRSSAAHFSALACRRAAPSAGRRIPTSSAMIPMTTNSSTRVNARFLFMANTFQSHAFPSATWRRSCPAGRIFTSTKACADYITRVGVETSRFCLNVKRNALRQRQILAVVDRVGGAAHVVFPGVGAGFASAAGALFAAEGSADLGTARADVHVGDPAIAARGRKKKLRLTNVGCKNCTGQ